MGKDELGVDEIGSRQSWMTPFKRWLKNQITFNTFSSPRRLQTQQF